ncbi:MAG: carboxypeptidase-like regulatory domain-containing protein, partial [Terriglobia bacterium]
MVKMCLRWACFVVIMLAAVPIIALSQATTSLTGTVTDPSGAVVPGAHVRLARTATGAVRSTITGADGLYEFNQ